jgi:hypothetical protein
MRPLDALYPNGRIGSAPLAPSTPPDGARGITVTPPSDTHDVGTQLRLVEAPEASRPRRRVAAGRRGRQVQPVRRVRRSVRWDEWRLDDRARRVGREGVAQARAALAQAQPVDPTTCLPKAS